MSQTKTIHVVDSQSSKVEEIEALEKILGLAGNGSYLASLFTNDFFNWASEMIRSDFAPDIMDNYQEAKNNSAQLAADLSKANARIAQMETEMADFEKAAQNRVDGLQKLLDSQRESTAQMSNWGASYMEKSNQQDEVISDLEHQVMALKAKIYDLEHKED